MVWSYTQDWERRDRRDPYSNCEPPEAGVSGLHANGSLDAPPTFMGVIRRLYSQCHAGVLVGIAPKTFLSVRLAVAVSPSNWTARSWRPPETGLALTKAA